MSYDTPDWWQALPEPRDAVSQFPKRWVRKSNGNWVEANVSSWSYSGDDWVNAHDLNANRRRWWRRDSFLKAHDPIEAAS